MSKTSYVPSPAKIKVIGLGGAGCNAVTHMVREQIKGIEFIAMNTDTQHLEITEAASRIQLGERTSRGLGVGGDHLLGQQAAEESRHEIVQAVAGADMVFITAGMGGGTGTGSAAIVAEITKQSGALTIGVVTRPFSFEGVHRNKVANEGIMNLMNKVDTLIIIPNDRLLKLCDKKTSIDYAFKLADEVLFQGVQAIAEVITVPGLINLDFADVRAIMKDAGPAWMSIGHGSGQHRAIDAARQALASPLLDVSVEGAKGVLFNIAGSDLTLFEVNNAAEVIREIVHPQANVIFGVVLDSNMGDEVRLTLIATGFTSVEAMTGSDHAKELEQFLKSSQTDDELDVPSFLRHEALSRQKPNTSRSDIRQDELKFTQKQKNDHE
ncbi:MAG: cell division protein FtsZ [Chloroflexi bacterium RBG_13_46_14]|nr:MAG: cell division protein FtsZ [Chloroflexi bacterium RBG_13_46_14]